MPGGAPRRNTPGHTIGSSIIGKDNPPNAASLAHSSQPPAAMGPAKSISIDQAHNGGWAVRHTPMGGGQSKTESPEESQLHMFRDAEQAHGHVGELMGVRLGSGMRRD